MFLVRKKNENEETRKNTEGLSGASLLKLFGLIQAMTASDRKLFQRNKSTPTNLEVIPANR
jgi:hypothetical protein